MDCGQGNSLAYKFMENQAGKAKKKTEVKVAKVRRFRALQGIYYPTPYTHHVAPTVYITDSVFKFKMNRYVCRVCVYCLDYPSKL